MMNMAKGAPARVRRQIDVRLAEALAILEFVYKDSGRAALLHVEGCPMTDEESLEGCDPDCGATEIEERAWALINIILDLKAKEPMERNDV